MVGVSLQHEKLYIGLQHQEGSVTALGLAQRGRTTVQGSDVAG